MRQVARALLRLAQAHGELDPDGPRTREVLDEALRVFQQVLCGRVVLRVFELVGRSGRCGVCFRAFEVVFRVL